jgi:hypothetical protein
MYGQPGGVAQRPQAYGQPPAAALSPQPQRGPFGRFLRAAWEFAVTAASVALFVGAWAGTIWCLAEDRPHRMLAGVVATVLFTPFAVHRLTGGRGRYGFGVAGAAAATAVAWRVVMRGGGDPAIALAAVFGGQVCACFVMSWLTRRKERPVAAPGS